MDKWLKPSITSKDKIHDSILMEQFLSDLKENIQKWVQCHCPKNLAKVPCLAEDFSSAQGDPPREKIVKAGQPATPRMPNKRVEQENKEPRSSPQGIVYFHFRRMGLIARDCFAGPQPYPPSTESWIEPKGSRPTGGPPD